MQNKQKNPNQTTIRLPEVVEGQTPFAAVLSFADARVPVEILFDRGIGDIFLVRGDYIGQATDTEAIKQATKAKVLYQVEQLNQSPIID